MFGKLFSILGKVVSVIPLVKELWYVVKKDVPRVVCPTCAGTGKVWIRHRPDKQPDSMDTQNTCPLCNGSGKIRSTDAPKG
jgi:hypothetical protein